ncbi:MAG: hypothetical protein KDC82_07515 [Bacteroidetes bacterium]|nr:hypothetical protein [Bacteroidota bacterium]
MISTASTSDTAITGYERSVTVEDTDLVRVSYVFSGSTATLGDAMRVNLYRDSTKVLDRQIRGWRNNTGGFDFNVIGLYEAVPGAGTYNYNLQWSSSGATIYSYFRSLIVEVLSQVS